MFDSVWGFVLVPLGPEIRRRTSVSTSTGISSPRRRWLSRQFGHRRFSFRTGSQTAQAAAERAGYGVALLPRYLAVDDPGLVQVSLAQRLPERNVWLLIRRDLKNLPRVRAVADYLIDVFRCDQRLLAGS